MECDVCNLRSSVGFCVECRKLLCEECAIKCSHCSKLICPEHVHETRSGRILCVQCMEERDSRRAERHAAATEAHEAESERPAEEEVQAEALVASARKPTPPWLMSLYAVGAGALVILVVLLVPGFRLSTLPWTGYLVILVSALGVFWAVWGLTKEEYFDDRPRCFVGLTIGIATIIASIWGIYAENERRKKLADEQRVGNRTYTTEQGRTEWREKVLDKFDK